MRTWTFKYKDRISGKTERKTIGRYPKVSLARAREIVAIDRAALFTGANPQASLRAQRQEERSAISFDALADRYLAEVSKIRKKASTAAVDKSNLVAARIAWKSRKSKDISRQDVIDFLDNRAKAAPIGANRTKTTLSHLFSWAVEKGILQTTPFINIAKPTKRETPKDRVLAENEIAFLWRQLENCDVAIAAALRVILLTGQRPGQVVAMERGELQHFGDLTRAAWHIPVGKRKDTRGNKRGPHVVPLSAMTIDAIEAALGAKSETDASPFVFASFRNPGNALDRHSLSRAMQRMIASLEGNDNKDIVDGLRADRPTPHDLRRTVATQLAALGITREDRMAVLDHSDGDVHDIHYDRHDRLREKRFALNAWAQKVGQIIGGPVFSAEIVPITSRRR